MKSLVRGACLLAVLFFLVVKFDSRTAAEYFSHQTETVQDKSQWTLLDSPSRSLLHTIKMFSRDKGIIAGRFLLEYNAGRWSISKSQPPSFRVDDIFATNEKNIWLTNNTSSNYSELYHFNGTKWQIIDHPFANTIAAMVLSDRGIEWLGGDRELARKNGGAWEYVPYPLSAGSITSIFSADSNRAWITTTSGKLLFYDGAHWYVYLKNEFINYNFSDSPNHGFILAKDKLYERSGFHFTIHSQYNLLSQIVKIAVVDKDDIWGIGNNGLVLHYYQNEWHKETVPTIEDLYDIQMLSTNEGWIVGNNGTILQYTNTKQAEHSINAAGFNPIKIISTSKELIDEYGVAMDDLNNDGLKDVYAVCIYDPNRLYMNESSPNASGKIKTLNFHEEAALRNATGVSADTNASNFRGLDLGVGLGDIDNDGDLDIYLCNLLGPNKLLLNDGTGYFRDVSNELNRGTNKNKRSNAAIWGDVNNDGNIDLFITNEESTNRLFLNDGSGHFTDVTESAGLITNGGGMGAAFGDIDGDGKLDLYVANWSAPNILYKNVSSKKNGVKFVDITDSAGVGGEPFAKSNAVCFADINNDGFLDLFVTNRKRSNRLYLNDGKGKFKDVTESYIGIDSMLSYGAVFGDFDQDGFQDLYVANVGDNVLYKNIDGKKFIPVTSEYGAQMGGYSTGVACGDIDNDGDLDLYVANYINGNSALFVNNLNNNNFIKLKIEGTKSNRDGIGTKVWLYKNSHLGEKEFLQGYREINGGSGYCSYNSREVHFGLKEAGVYDAIIYFPASGIKKVVKNIASGNLYTVSEEEGIAASLTLASKSLHRFLIEPDVHFEILKFLVVMLIISFSIFWGKRRYSWNRNNQIAFHGIAIVLYWAQITLFIHKGFFLSTTLPLIFILTSLIILHLIYERVIMARINKIERQATRDRIARDLHDDLASTLSSSAIYTEALKRSLKEVSLESKELLDRINSLLMEASDSVTDIVWAVSPSHDTIDDLICRLKEFITDCCRAKNIEVKTQINLDKSDYKILEEQRRNIYLIFKEATNNIIKHSYARVVYFNVEIKKTVFQLSLKDDGIGLPENEFSKEELNGDAVSKIHSSSLHGNGLKNMARRAEEITAQLKIISTHDKGTEIILICKMT